MFFYEFEMAAYIVFVCQNAVEAIYFFFAPSHHFWILEYKIKTWVKNDDIKSYFLLNLPNFK